MSKQLGDLIARVKMYAKSKTARGVLVGIVVFVVVVQLLWIFVPWWSGFEGKTLWDLLDLLIVPIVLAGGALLLSYAENKTEREMATERRREDALQNYLDRMTELMLEKGLRQSEGEPENKEIYEAARDVARARTLTVLRILDGERKGILLRFLYESELIRKGDEQKKVVITLHDADLSGANLRWADLGNANLIGTILSGAILSRANLIGANLNGARLTGANLIDAYLGNANLRNAKLRGADLNGADLSGANLRGAVLIGASLFRANLIEANLSGANLGEADLSGANLRGARLFRTYLSKADLIEADLSRANLKGANLSEADLTEANLIGASFDEATILPDGTKWTPETDLIRFTEAT